MPETTTNNNVPLADLEPEQGITEQRAAAILGVSATLVRRVMKSGELPFYEVGTARRIRLDDVYRFQRGYRDADYTKALRDLVDLAPKLSPAQRDLIAAAFGGGDAA